MSGWDEKRDEISGKSLMVVCSSPHSIRRKLNHLSYHKRNQSRPSFRLWSTVTSHWIHWSTCSTVVSGNETSIFLFVEYIVRWSISSPTNAINYFRSIKMTTVGDIARSTAQQIEVYPIPPPKLANIQKALSLYEERLVTSPSLSPIIGNNGESLTPVASTSDETMGRWMKLVRIDVQLPSRRSFSD